MKVLNESPEYVSDAQSGDLVDFGHYGQLYIVRDLGDSYWVSDRPGDQRGWSIKKYLAREIIKSSNDDEEVDESVRIRVNEGAGALDELHSRIMTKMESLLDAFHNGEITDDELMTILNKVDEDLDFEVIDEAIPAIVAAIGTALASDAAVKLANDK